MFKCGDLIVYGNNGVCRVEEITCIDAANDKLYYVLKNLSSNGTAYVPVDGNVYIRPVMSKDEMTCIIDKIPEITTEIFNGIQPRDLQKVYRDTLLSHDSIAILSLIKHIRSTAKKKQALKKKLSVTEERFLDQALKVIGSELSAAFDVDIIKAKEDILNRLEND